MPKTQREKLTRSARGCISVCLAGQADLITFWQLHDLSFDHPIYIWNGPTEFQPEFKHLEAVECSKQSNYHPFETDNLIAMVSHQKGNNLWVCLD